MKIIGKSANTSGQPCCNLQKLGHLQVWNSSFPKELIATDSDDDLDDDYIDDLDPEEFGLIDDAGLPLAARTAEKHGAAAHPDSWQLLLNKIKRSEASEERPPSWPFDREILYILQYTRLIYGASLSIRIDVRDRRKNGDWKKPKPLTLPQNMISELPDAADREILGRLVGVNREKWYYRPYESTYRFQPLRQDLLTILPVISKTNRFHFQTPESGDGRMARWDEAGPWEFCIEAHPDEASRRYEIRGAFHRSGARLSIEQAEYHFRRRHPRAGRICARRIIGSFRWISLFRKEGSFFVPYDEADTWIETMMQMPASAPPGASGGIAVAGNRGRAKTDRTRTCHPGNLECIESPG